MPKDAQISNDFNAEVVLPKKLEKQFKGLILRHGRLFENFIPDDVHNANHDEIYQFFTFSNIHNIASRQFEDTKVLQARRDIAELTPRDRELCNDIVNLIYHNMINYFSGLTINEARIFSPKKRKERVKKIRKKTAKPFQEISLKPYVPHFVRWICNSELPAHQYVTTAVSWAPEDWDSDAISIIRGYLISKKQNDNKAQFRLEDFDQIHTTYLVGEPGKIKGVKDEAAKYIPLEGTDFVRLALSETPNIDQSKLPDIWQKDEFTTLSMPSDIYEPPQADILHADNDYILIHLKNEAAAKSFGSNPAWCITRETIHWEHYSENFLFICDKDEERYGINLPHNICDNSADLPVPIKDVFEQYDGLEAHISKFYASQLKNAVARNDLKSTCDLLFSWNSAPIREYNTLVLTSFDPEDIKSATLDMFKRTHSQFVHNLFEVYRWTEQTRQYFIGNDFIKLPFELYRRGLVTNSSVINSDILDFARLAPKELNPVIQQEINELATHGHKHKLFINNMVELTGWIKMPEFPKPKTPLPSSP